MVGGFVQQQKVAALQKERCQHKAAFFATRKGAHLPFKIILPQHEEPENTHQLFFRGVRI